MSPFFLNLEEVLAIHEDRIRKYSGSSGPRDLALFQSALGTVEATFGGVYLNETLFEMAAAYLFHIRRKKIAAPPNKLYDLVIGVAEGKITKAAVVVFFQEHS